MTRTYEQFLRVVADFGPDFEVRVREHVLPKVAAAKLRITRLGVVVAENAPGCFAPYGCPTCLGVAPGQERDGTPSVSGKRCLDAAEQGVVPGHMPDIAVLNLWFCPDCKMPVSSLFPRFE